jgi:16S rRNA (cytidine1402-2'-O)-methyltransferase
MPGTLFVVATPIGNLEDITARALRVLAEVSLIAAEDTRRTAHLLARYAITTPTTSLHEHNEEKKSASLVARLSHGESIALVSDAGTPTVSDPGHRLIAAAIEAGIRVEPPGLSAALAALAASGLPLRRFFPFIKAKD